jgi:NAD(P)-dependent dehydrogenase (short-subunit alcohol dehydrogenase family)
MGGRRFDGKVVLVTGAGSGIGRATALAFAEAGAKVALDDISAERGQATLRMIRDAGGEAIFIEADVADEEAVRRLVARTVEAYGRLDCAFNNAGISEGFLTGEEWDSEIFLRTLSINTTGVFYCMKHEIPEMLKSGGGAIVNTASVAGMAGPGQPSYVASKHAVVGLTRAIALSHATRGIRVNAVCPGAIDTPMVQRVVDSSPEHKRTIENMHPMNRIGRPREIADAVLFLCSDEASFVTGHPFAIDGGVLARA